MLQTLQLQNIRSYANGLFEFKPGVNIIVGPNASGKTNLLESIALLCQGSAFKSTDENMIRLQEPWGRIDGTISSVFRTAKLQRDPFRKTFILDDIEKKRLSSRASYPVVLFEPEHMLLLSSEPERRRSYIDTVLKLTEKEFSQTTTKYKRALAQRNRLLKTENVQAGDMFVWDLQISELAGKIVEARQAYITKANKELTRRYRSVSGNKETLQLHYESKVEPGNYAASLMDMLANSFETDRLRGFTGVGPHRDDVRILLNERDARTDASRGESRSIILALKITELELVARDQDRQPLLLLDDVFSELDGKRRQTLAKTLQKYQTFITTTDADVVIEHFTESNIIPITN